MSNSSSAPEKLGFESAPDADVYLVTGMLTPSVQSQPVMAVGYVFASSPEMALEAQSIACPQLRLTGAVSLHDLKEQVSRLESARRGELPALASGPYAESLAALKSE